MKRPLLVLCLAFSLIPCASPAPAGAETIGRLDRAAVLKMPAPVATPRARHGVRRGQKVSAPDAASSDGQPFDQAVKVAPTRWTEQDKVVHVLNRLTFGPSPGDIKAVESMGIDRYIEQQLHPENIPQAYTVTDFTHMSAALTKTPDELVSKYGNAAAANMLEGKGLDPKTEDGKKAIRKLTGIYFKEVVNDTTKAKLLSAIDSPRQLQEVMTEFWFNHFNIFSGKGNDRLWLGAYETQAIRPYALGKFRDIVGATCHHAAMLVYLDNSTNSAPRTVGNKTIGLNENYARELMELHTLGVDGGYTQDDVIQLAHILTGLTVAGHDKTGALRTETCDLGSYFNRKRHDFGDKVLLGHTIKGSGEGEIEEALDLLCKHPSTAHHISYQLAQYFVCDAPPKALVDRLAAKFTESDGDIREVLRTLFHSPEFMSPTYADAKFKSPVRYMISVMRATGSKPSDYQRVAQYLRTQGEPLYGCLTPDGYKNVRSAWLNPDALLHRSNFAVDLTSGKFRAIKGGNFDCQSLQDTLGMNLSPTTVAALNQAPDDLKPALLLGSPEFMLY